MTRVSDYILVSGTSGLRLGASLEKLRPFIGQEIFKLDLEDTLCDLPQTRTRLRDVGVTSPGIEGRIRMMDVTWELPKVMVKELWDLAADYALNRIEHDPSESIRVLTSKFVYYGGRRHEFYSPVTIWKYSNAGLRPRCVVVLIDDVFDMFLRLAPEGELMDRMASWGIYLSRFEDNEKVKFSELPGVDQHSVALRHTVGQIRRLLTWRQMEISVAENVAHEAKCPLLVWSIKQLAEPIAKWMVNPDICRTYLSHPISAARRRQRSSPDGSWPDIVDEFNGVQAALFAQQVIAIMPSGIDELRFLPVAAEDPADVLPLHYPQLTKRWTLPDGTLVWIPPDDTGSYDLYDVLSTKPLVTVPDVRPSGAAGTGRRKDATIRALEDIIGDQISSRDHLFVEHCKSLFVYRALLGGNPYSHGVRAELDHWAELAQHFPDRRAAFVHTDQDIADFNEYLAHDVNFQSARLEALQSHRRDIVARLTGYDDVKSLQLLRKVEAHKPDASILDEGFMPAKLDLVQRNMAAIVSEAEKRWLDEYLQYGLMPPRIRPAQVKVWRVPESKQILGMVPQVAEFLKS